VQLGQESQDAAPLPRAAENLAPPPTETKLRAAADKYRSTRRRRANGIGADL
jgi:hypothetical protein